MHSNNQNNTLHIVVRCFLFFFVVLVLLYVCNFLIAKENTYTRVMMHEMYNPPKNIDVVFMGTSTCFPHYNPKIWDNHLEMYTFNAGSSSQQPIDSYYLLKEILTIHHLKYCIYDLNYSAFLSLEGFNNPTKSYILSDYFKPSLNKLQFFLHAYNGESIYVGAIPFLRYKAQLSPQLIIDNIHIKTSSGFKEYGYKVYDTDSKTYEGRGFLSDINQTEFGHVGEIEPYYYSPEIVNTKMVYYLQKIAELCSENNCELILSCSPLPYAHMALQDNYQAICDFYQYLATENNVKLFNFSLSKPAFLPIDDSFFRDYAHMSDKGATAFSATASQLIADYISGKEIDYDSIFYSSYQELMDASPYVFNAWITQDEDVYTANCTYGNGVTPEYQFSWRDAQEDTWQVLQEYSPAETLDKNLVPTDTVELRVCVRPVSCTEDYQQWDSIVLSP